MKPVIIITIAFVLLLVPISVYAERNCEPETVCVQTGDYLRYEIFSGESLLEFTDMLSDDRINFKWTYFNQDGSLDSEQFYILDRTTGNYTINVLEQELEVPLLHFFSKEILSNYSDEGFCNEIQFDFNGIKRNVLSCDSEDGTIQAIIDVETSVLIEFVIETGSFKSTNKLLDTNIFSTKDFTETVSKTTISEPTPESKIPDWIKNNAKWWSEGSIDDFSFVQGIQYLIKEGILNIPDSDDDFEKSSEIPDWIKTVAGYWADDMISDDDFIMSIQFLIENGIISID